MIYYKNSYLCRVLKPTIKSNREKLVRALALRNGLDKKKYTGIIYTFYGIRKKNLIVNLKDDVCV
jgi:hypothetical protein